MRIISLLTALALAAGALPALAETCPNPNALGTSRTLVIDSSHLRLGSMQYHQTLPLGPREVVLTFDDGPLPPYSTRILDILKSECVKATYFLVGEMAKSFPDVVRRIHAEGHTIGTHSYDHPLTFHTMPLAAAEQEIEGGIAAVSKAAGDPSDVAPFFRIPGLLRASSVENYLASRSLVTWSADIVADDWFRHINAAQIAERAIGRIEAHGGGILLLHDIHPATALALPTILKELKARGYHIVHVVPAGTNRPATTTDPQQWVMFGKHRRGHSASAATNGSKPRLLLSREDLGVDRVTGPLAIAPYAPSRDLEYAGVADELKLPVAGLWPSAESAVVPEQLTPLPTALEKDWPLAIRPANLVPGSAAAWPALAPAKPRGTAQQNRAARASRTYACANGEVDAVGLDSGCKKPAGHELTLSPRGRAG